MPFGILIFLSWLFLRNKRLRNISALKETSPADTLILDFQRSELWEKTCLTFQHSSCKKRLKNSLWPSLLPAERNSGRKTCLKEGSYPRSVLTQSECSTQTESRLSPLAARPSVPQCSGRASKNLLTRCSFFLISLWIFYLPFEVPDPCLPLLSPKWHISLNCPLHSRVSNS